MIKLLLKTTLLLLLMVLSGCGVLKSAPPQEMGHFYINPHTDFGDIGRVAVLEVKNESNRADLASQLTDSVSEALQKKHLFSVTTLSPDDPAWRRLAVGDDDISSYSIRQLDAVRSQLKVNAVIYGSITEYRPYPHMLMGLRLKMLDLRDGKLLWAMEQVWDSTDKNIEMRMKHFYKDYMRDGYQPIGWQLLVTSPRAFNKFVVHEVAATFGQSNEYMKRTSSAKTGRNFSKKPTIFEKIFKIQ
jgi:hypothetical protein